MEMDIKGIQLSSKKYLSSEKAKKHCCRLLPISYLYAGAEAE